MMPPATSALGHIPPNHEPHSPSSHCPPTLAVQAPWGPNQVLACGTWMLPRSIIGEGVPGYPPASRPPAVGYAGLCTAVDSI